VFENEKEMSADIVCRSGMWEQGSDPKRVGGVEVVGTTRHNTAHEQQTGRRRKHTDAIANSIQHATYQSTNFPRVLYRIVTISNNTFSLLHMAARRPPCQECWDRITGIECTDTSSVIVPTLAPALPCSLALGAVVVASVPRFNGIPARVLLPCGRPATPRRIRFPSVVPATAS